MAAFESDLSDVASVMDADEEEFYEESQELVEDEENDEIPVQEEDDDYQYVPEYEEEEEEESVAPKPSARSGRIMAKVVDEADEYIDDDDGEFAATETYNPRATTRRTQANKAKGLLSTPQEASDKEDEITSSSAPQRKRKATVEIEEEDEEDETEANEIKTTSRSKMIMELMDDQASRKKEKLTEEEIQLRRAETARKRKNLSEKKLEEEKQDTINKLLKRRAGKSRSNVKSDNGNGNGSNNGNDQRDLQDENSFIKPRRPYNSTGLVRTLRTTTEDFYCTY